jgi:DNA-binding MarR family transcriptional regulator
LTVNADTSTARPPAGPPLIGALMRMPGDAVRARILSDLHRAGFTDIVAAHLTVLRYPGPDGRRPSDLAAEAGMSRQAMNYLLGEVERLGYLVREGSPEDHRSKRVRVTARGLAVQRATRRIVRAIEAELARELGADRLEQLRALLVALNETDFVRARGG